MCRSPLLIWPCFQPPGILLNNTSGRGVGSGWCIPHAGMWPAGSWDRRRGAAYLRISSERPQRRRCLGTQPSDRPLSGKFGSGQPYRMAPGAPGASAR